MINRSALFIDNAYLHKCTPQNIQIDFEILSDYLCRDTQKLRTYFYDCMPYQSNPSTENEKIKYSQYSKFISVIEKLPRFQTRFGKLSKREDGSFEQKRVDILLAVELVRLSWSKQIGHAIIIAGDSDFVPAIEAAKDAGVIVSLYYSNQSIHNELLSSVDERYLMGEDFFNTVKRQ
ncbi:NYN domain-containing protein [Methanoplanus sp. FWC-SCC4]|uniref:NYN domain-containing protein n=1 Tax=Methanochimaera problematica TaxID=2609417 RepID=A0AA97FDB3_9EURY|nr:NYN domain-containing protein [Methanoplanus sp. FWC-SCC4]WOF16854.1 NYN domain-containing protein [Methanoplanus sp. FWC-SCC4]